jgi:hypothetical protein
MEFVVGTSGGVFVGASRRPSDGIDERGVRHLGQVGNDLFAGAADGVYRSGDGGRSWTRSGVEGSEVWNVAAASDESRTLYASTQPAHLYASRDGGDTWLEVDTFLQVPGAERWCVPNNPQGARALALAFDPFNPRQLWVGVEVGGVVASDDGGAHWSVTQPGGNADVHVLAVHPGRSGVVYATTGYGRNDDQPMDSRMAGLYRSEDGGKAWRHLGATMQPHYTRPICIDPRPPHALTVPCAPDVRSSIKDPGGAQSVLYRSDDDGETWRSLGDAQHSPSAARITAVTPDAERRGGVLAGTETGEVWRVAPDATWTQLTEGLPTVQTLLAIA